MLMTALRGEVVIVDFPCPVLYRNWLFVYSAVYAILHPMRQFETPHQLYTEIGGLFERIATKPEVQETLKSLRLCVRFSYTEPDATMTLSAADGEYTVVCGHCDAMPDVELTMTGDVAHRFWMGELNVMEAITKRDIGVNGSLGKIMRLTPLIKLAIRSNRERA